MEKSFDDYGKTEGEDLGMFEKKLRHLSNISRVIQENSNTLSSYYAYRRLELQKDKLGSLTWLSICSFCGRKIVPGSQDRFRLSPRRRLSYKLQKLIPAATVKRIGPYQRRCVNKFIHSTNCLRIRCSSCNKTSVVPCQSRQNREQQRCSQSDIEEIKDEKSRKQKRREKKRQRRKEKLEQQEEGYIEGIQVKTKTSGLPSIHNNEDGKSIQQSKSVAKDNMTDQNARGTSDYEAGAQQKPCSKLILSMLQRGGIPEGKSTEKDNKTKTKRYHQQLAVMLKGEKKEQKNSSLKDFLSSM